MKKAYKYKLLPNKQQKILLKNHMFAAVQAYNILLSLINSKDKYTNTELDDIVKEKIRNRELLYNTKVLQQERVRFLQNYYAMLKKRKEGIPVGDLKYKYYSHNEPQSFQTTKEQFKILSHKNDKYKILKLFKQQIKIRWTRDIPSEYKSITISFDGIDFYISFNVIEENGIDRNNRINSNNRIAIDYNTNNLDLGNNSFHKKFSINQLREKNKKLAKKISKLDRKLSKKKEKLKKKAKLTGEKSWKKTKRYMKLQLRKKKLERKIKERRNYFHHELSNKLIKFLLEQRINHVIIEKLNIQDMTSKKNINKSIGKQKSKSMKKNILDFSISRFYQIFSYKCVQFGIIVEAIEPRYSSKTCSSCGTINNELTLKERIFQCKACNLELDRDYNACLNLLRTAETAGIVR